MNIGCIIPTVREFLYKNKQCIRYTKTEQINNEENLIQHIIKQTKGSLNETNSQNKIGDVNQAFES
jgi:hypothetical protein